MKKTITVISLLAGAYGLHAQGALNWKSYIAGSFAASIYSVNPATPTQGTSGPGAYDIPTGTTTYGGAVFLGGANTGTGSSGLPGVSGTYNGNLWTVGLYVDTSAAAVSTDVLTGTPLATATIATTAGGGFWGATGANANNLPVNTPYPHSSTVFLELAAWYNGGGAASYAAAFAAGVPTGHDTPGTLTLNSATSTPPTLTGSGLTGFDLATSIPEPSTIALGVIGASTLLFRRRK